MSFYRLFKPANFILLLAIILLLSVVSSLASYVLSSNISETLDFLAYYTGGHLVLDHAGSDFYLLTRQFIIQHLFVPGVANVNQIRAYFYPPFFALPLAVISLFPPKIAFVLLLLVNMYLLIPICFFAIKILKDIPRSLKIHVISSIITFAPVYHSFTLNQPSTFLTFIFLGAWYFLYNKKDFYAGLLLSLLLIKPYLLLLPALYLIRYLKKSAIAGLVLGAVVVLGISFIMIGFAGFVNYIKLFVHSYDVGFGVYGLYPKIMVTWQGLLYNIFNTENAKDIFVPYTIGVLLIVGLLVYSWFKNNRIKSFEVEWSLLTLATLIIAPHGYLQDLSILIVPGVLLMRFLFRKNFPKKFRKYILLILLITYILLYYLFLTYGFTNFFILFTIVWIIILFIGLFYYYSKLNSQKVESKLP